MGELGVFIKEGKLNFNPVLLRANEFLKEASVYDYVSVEGDEDSIVLSENSLAFSCCQVPVVYKLSNSRKIKVYYPEDTPFEIEGLTLDLAISTEIFSRSGKVKSLEVYLTKDVLR